MNHFQNYHKAHLKALMQTKNQINKVDTSLLTDEQKQTASQTKAILDIQMECGIKFLA